MITFSVIHYDYEQGTPEWQEARQGAITGSNFKVCRERLADKTDKKTGEITRGGPSSKAILYAKDTARQRMGGKVVEKFQTQQMRMGREQEVFARRAYERKTGNLCEAVGFFATEDKLFGLSPDSLIGDDGVLEIKLMASSDTLFTAMVEGDIGEYMDQCLGYLWLLGRQWVDLVLYAPDLEHQGLGMKIIRIDRSDPKVENAIESLEADLMAFARLVRTYQTALRDACEANRTPEPVAA